MKNNFVRLVLILFIAAVVRIFFLNQSLWLDEGIAAVSVKDMTISQYYAGFLPGDFHPPLYFIIQKLFFSLFGGSELVFRLPAYISGILLVGVVYLIAKETLPKGPNRIYPTLLTVTSPLLVYYSSEARAYSATALMVCLNLYFLLLLKRKFNYKKYLLYLVTLVLLVYLNYVAYFYLITSLILLVLSLFRQQKHFDSKVILSGFVAVIFAVPILPVLQKQLSLGANISANFPGWDQIIGSKNPFINAIQFFIKIVSGRVDFDYSLLTKVLSVLGVSVLLYAIVIKVYRKRVDCTLIIFASSLMLILAASIVIPIYSYFRLIFLIPLLMLVVSNLNKNERISSVIFYLIFSLNSVFLFYFYMNPTFWKEDWKGAVTYTQYLSATHPDSLAVFPTLKPYEVFTYYYAGQSLGSGDSFVIKSVPEYKKESILLHQNIIYYDYLSDLTDPQGETLSFLKSNYNEETGYSFNKVGGVRLFVKK